MGANDSNSRYEAIVDAALTFFTILVGLKLADLIDKNGALGVDKWPCFIAGVAVLFRYVSGSFNHQRAQYVNQPGQHDGEFLFDIGFLIAFGIIAVWASVAEAVPAFLYRLIVFTVTAFVWTVWNLVVAKPGSGMKPFAYSPWFWLNLAQLCVLVGAKVMWPSHQAIGALGLELRSLWILSVVAVLLLFSDLALQLRHHHPPTTSSTATA
jgi:hypothetical protein